MPAIPPHVAFLNGECCREEEDDDDASSHIRVAWPYVRNTEAFTTDAIARGGPIPAHKLLPIASTGMRRGDDGNDDDDDDDDENDGDNDADDAVAACIRTFIESNGCPTNIPALPATPPATRS
jgi:hypothetical protein